MEKISIVVCAHNDRKNIHYVLQGLDGLAYQKLEIIIIDDFSSDDTAEIIDKFISGKPKFTFHTNSRNLGLAASMNKGIKKSTGKYIIFLQSDCLVRDSMWVNKLLKAKRKNAEVAVVASQRIIPDKQGLNIGTKFFNSVCPQELLAKSDAPREIEFFRGKADLVEKTALEQTGGFDNKTFFLSGEDTDFSYKLKKLGKKIIISPEAQVEYLFSSRQDSILAGLQKALLYGKTAVPLFKRWKYDGLRSRNYLYTIISIIPIILLPFYILSFLVSILLFLWSFTMQVKLPLLKQKIPIGLLSILFLPVAYLAGFSVWNLLSISIFLSAILILLVAGLRGFQEALAQKLGLSISVGAFFYGIAFKLLLGTGYLFGKISSRS